MKATAEVTIIEYKEGLKDGKKWQYLTVQGDNGINYNLFGDVEKYKEIPNGTKQLIDLNIRRYMDTKTNTLLWSVKIC